MYKIFKDVRINQSDMKEIPMKVESTVENTSRSLNKTETCGYNKGIGRTDT